MPEGFSIRHHVWRKREIENYIASKRTLMAFSFSGNPDDLIVRAELETKREAMEGAIKDIESAFIALRRDPWSIDTKISDDVLDPLFSNYYDRLRLSNRMHKSDYHLLVDTMTPDDVDDEMIEVLDRIVQASTA